MPNDALKYTITDKFAYAMIKHSLTTDFYSSNNPMETYLIHNKRWLYSKYTAEEIIRSDKWIFDCFRSTKTVTFV